VPTPSVDVGPTLEAEPRDAMKAAGLSKFITWVKGLRRRSGEVVPVGTSHGPPRSLIAELRRVVNTSLG
jgi:hypothetical protein